MSKSRQERRVVIVDDSRTIQAMLDNAFSLRPDFRVVGFSREAKSAAEVIRRLRPDIVTIDLCMPYIDGAALLDMIADLKDVCKIIVSDSATQSLVLTSKLRDSGASACLTKKELITDPKSFFAKINEAYTNLQLTLRRRPAAGVADRNDHAGLDTVAPEKAPMRYPIPVDEKLRVATLKRKRLANSVRESQFDAVTKHVATMTAFPACLLTFLDRDTQWIKSAYGLDVGQTPREQAFCNYTISQGGLFVVTNATTDERFSENPLVTGVPYIKSYVGHPVTIRDGTCVGTLCVIDAKLRTVSSHTVEQLAGMSTIVAEMIDVRPDVAA